MVPMSPLFVRLARSVPSLTLLLAVFVLKVLGHQSMDFKIFRNVNLVPLDVCVVETG